MEKTSEMCRLASKTFDKIKNNLKNLLGLYVDVWI